MQSLKQEGLAHRGRREGSDGDACIVRFHYEVQTMGDTVSSSASTEPILTLSSLTGCVWLSCRAGLSAYREEG